MSDTAELTHFKPKDLPDLTGTRAVITGANSGIGFHTAAALVEHGADVVLACRNTEAGREAAKSSRGVQCRGARRGLADVDHGFVERYDGGLDLLINNAGVMPPPKYRTTAEGHELQFGTNHLGHFALTGLLLPRLKPGPPGSSRSRRSHTSAATSRGRGQPRAGYKPRRPTARASWPT